MSIINRKYVTLEATKHGSADVYCSCVMENDNSRDKISISLNGEICGRVGVVVIVESSGKYYGVCLGELDKKSDKKFSLKKTYQYIENTNYVLSDVKAVIIIELDTDKILYEGFTDNVISYKNNYAMVGDNGEKSKKNLDKKLQNQEIEKLVNQEMETETETVTEMETETETVTEMETETVTEKTEEIEEENIGIVEPELDLSEVEAEENEEVSEEVIDFEDIVGALELYNMEKSEALEMEAYDEIPENETTIEEKCADCRYKIIYDKFFSDKNFDIDFDKFAELYKDYEQNNNISFNEQEDTIDDRIISRLEPLEDEVFEDETKVINSSFFDYSNGRSEDFYKCFRNSNFDNDSEFENIELSVMREIENIKELMSIEDIEAIDEDTTVGKVKIDGKENLKELIYSSPVFDEFENLEKNIKWAKVKMYQIVGYFDDYWKMFWEPFIVDSYGINEYLLLGVDDENNYFLGVLSNYINKNIKEAERLEFDYFEVIGDSNEEITPESVGYFIKKLACKYI